jgi:hypothetical protein
MACGTTAQYRALAFCSSGFETCDVLRGGVGNPSSNPQSGGPGLHIYDPQKTGWPNYTLKHWVARGLGSATSRSHNDFEPCDSLLSYCFTHYVLIKCNGARAPSGPGPPHYRSFTITLRHTTLSRTLLDKWSARRGDLSTRQHTTLTRDRHPCAPAGFEPALG